MQRSIPLAAALAVLAAAPAARAWPGCEQDRLHATVQGDTLTVHHSAAVYNCCMDGCAYTVAQDDSTVRVVETETVTNPCACVCCYDLSVTITDLAPGDFTLAFAWYDHDTGQWEEWSGPISGSAPGGPPAVAAAVSSGCLDPTAAPSEDDGCVREPWGRVKARYE